MKIAFCFPGQGSQDVGMGRAIAEEFPAARAVYDEAVGGGGLRRREALLRGVARGADAHGAPAAGARRHLDRLPPRREDARDRAGLRRSATPSASTRRSPPPDAIGDRRRRRARPRARRGDGRGRAGDTPARWPRCSASRTRSSRSCAASIDGRVAGELQLPRPDRRLRRELGGRPSDRGRRPRSAPARP